MFADIDETELFLIIIHYILMIIIDRNMHILAFVSL